jgi:hypothetical protein
VVTWYDNFSKLYHLNTPSFKRGEYASALWTGIGHHLPINHVPDGVQLQFTQEGVFIDAMPPSVFDDGIVRGVLKWLREFNNPQSQPDMFSSSVCNTLDIRSVPLKIRPQSSPEPDHPLFATYDQRAISMDTFVPAGVAEWNIGSNNGLAMLLKREFDQIMVDDDNLPTQYRMIFADVNIFERLMKVMMQLIIQIT